jgi:DsbC/DsbD-like thiol-disulfide interchange protein
MDGMIHALAMVALACTTWNTSTPAQRPSDVVHWTAKAATGTIAQGGTITIAITADIEEGWHVYALTQPKGGPIPLAIGVTKSQPFDVDIRRIKSPAPTIASDPNFNLETHYYEGPVTLTVPVMVKRTAPLGKGTVPVEVTFQACSNRICLRPFTETISVDVSITGGTKGGRR